jgi:glutamyl-tRNA reductase
MVFSSTGSTLPILGKGAIESALKARRNDPIFIVDLAIPRDVEAQVADLKNVYLYTIDDLNQVISDNVANRRQAAVEAEKIVEDQTMQFMHWYKNLQSIPTIRQIRKQTSQLVDTELANALRRLEAGDAPADVLQLFAHSLSQKFMHQPTEKLRERHDEELLSAARDLFDLDSKNQ